MKAKMQSKVAFLFILSLVILSLASTFPIATAKKGFEENFNRSSIPKKWYTYSMDGTYGIENGILNLRSTDYTPWASISLQSNCKPIGRTFKIAARVRNNGGFGVYLALFVSNQTFIVSKDGGENSECTRNTIAVEDDYESFKVCRGTSPTAIHWSWFHIASVGTIGDWYVLELEVIKEPYQVIARIYDDSNILLGTGTISDMVLPYNRISVVGVAVWRGVPSGDSLANFDVDWVKSENLILKGLPKPRIHNPS